jgi:hypothetical protein
MLKVIAFPFYNSLLSKKNMEFIFIRDKAKVYKGIASLVKSKAFINTFKPLSVLYLIYIYI